VAALPVEPVLTFDPMTAVQVEPATAEPVEQSKAGSDES
jgi:hypothetical protein